MQKYTCPMHPDVITDHPGNCPKCGMKLVPVEREKTPNVQRPTLNIEGQSPIAQATRTITPLRSPRRPTARQASMGTKKCTRLRTTPARQGWKCTPPSISRIR